MAASQYQLRELGSHGLGSSHWAGLQVGLHFRGRDYAPVIRTAGGLDDVTTSARALTVLRPNVDIYTEQYKQMIQKKTPASLVLK